MAKKSRTPPPPRRPVQAPKARVDARDPAESRRALPLLVAFAFLGLLMLGAVLLWFTLRGGNSGGGSKAFAAQMREGGCSYRKTADEGQGHVRDGTKVTYKAKPVPTSGDHYGRPAIWNAYDAQVEQERLVHNLEHGGIAIQYGKDVPRATVDQLNEFYLDSPNGIVLAPLPRLGETIAMTAWSQLATCTRFDEAAFKAFRSEFRYKGPERFPPESLAPGL